MLEIEGFLGINTDLKIDPNSIPHTAMSFLHASFLVENVSFQLPLFFKMHVLKFEIHLHKRKPKKKNGK